VETWERPFVISACVLCTLCIDVTFWNIRKQEEIEKSGLDGDDVPREERIQLGVRERMPAKRLEKLYV
jgi:hypothetical protein